VERLSLSASSTSAAVSLKRDLASKLKRCETESTSAAVILLSKEKLRLSEFANSLSRPNLEGIFLDRYNGTLKGEACAVTEEHAPKQRLPLQSRGFLIERKVRNDSHFEKDLR